MEQHIIYPLLFLLMGASLLFFADYWARRWGLPKALGIAGMLSIVGLGLLESPASWRAALVAGESGDTLLTLARLVGLSGLFFLAGLRSDLRTVLKVKRVLLTGAGAAILLGLVFALLFRGLIHNDDSGALVVLAGSLVGAGLWIPSGVVYRIGQEEVAPSNGFGQAMSVALTGVTVLVVHFWATFETIIRHASSGSALTIAGLYEIVKVVMVFSFAYFIASRFLARAGGKMTETRLILVYLLIAALLFAMAMKATDPLLAVAWAYLAGGLWAQSDLGRKLGKSNRPVAESILWSCAFLGVLLQTHGRHLSGIQAMSMVLFVFLVLVIKFSTLFFGIRLSGRPVIAAARASCAGLASGEAAVLFLGFGVTRWSIDGAIYFSVLVFALISMFFAPLLMRSLASRAASKSRPGIPLSSNKNRKKSTRSLKALVFLVASFDLSFGALRLQAASDSVSVSHSDTLGATPATALPRTMDSLLESLRADVNHQAEAASLSIQVETLTRAGKAALKTGDLRSAEQDYTKARQLIIASREDVFYDPTVRSLFFQLNYDLVTANEGSRISAPFDRVELSPDAERQVRAFERYFAGKGRRTVDRAQARLEQYQAMMQRVFREEGVPEDLIYVGPVESAYNPYARSTVGATGMWQFVSDTGRRYGLRQTGVTDDRVDPEKSTRAAARYLHDLYGLFGDWPLALAAYNSGEYRVLRIIQRTGVRDFWQMSREGLLPQETRNYVPAVLAAIHYYSSKPQR